SWHVNMGLGSRSVGYHSAVRGSGPPSLHPSNEPEPQTLILRCGTQLTPQRTDGYGGDCRWNYKRPRAWRIGIGVNEQPASGGASWGRFFSLSVAPTILTPWLPAIGELDTPATAT